ncbi:MAG: TetR family transcriptional regulator C-terminal domain-containing protein [Pseudomonadota bacterium]
MTNSRIGRPPGEQKENAARRRHQLIQAAIDSIVTHGLSATTLATVSKSAGLSQGVAVFYFKSKETLLVETLRAHYEEYDALWRRAVSQAGPAAIDRLLALVMADLDPAICTPRNMALWSSFWGEAPTRPRFAALCEFYDQQRDNAIKDLCRQTEALISAEQWTPLSVAQTLDSLSDGMWLRMHISPGSISLDEGRQLLARLMSTIYPTEREKILSAVKSYVAD